MALTDINLEEMSPRTTLTRSDLALLRNVTAHLDNGVEFGDLIKQLYANMVQADITGSTGYGLLEADIAEHVRTEIQVDESIDAEQVIKESIGRFSDDDIMFLKGGMSFETHCNHANSGTFGIFSNMIRWPDTTSAPRSFTLAKTDRTTIFTAMCDRRTASSEVALGAIALFKGGGAYYEFELPSSYTWASTQTYGQYALTHYSAPRDRAVTYTSDWVGYYIPGDWENGSAYNRNHGTRPQDIVDNGKDADGGTTSASNRVCFMSRAGDTSTTQNIWTWMDSGKTDTIPLTGTGAIIESIAFSPTHDKYVTVVDSANGSGGIYTDNGYSSGFSLDSSDSNLTGSKIRWMRDRMVICNGNQIKHSTDLSTWTSYTFTSNSTLVINNVKQLTCFDGYETVLPLCDFPWFVLLCNQGKLIFTKDWENFYETTPQTENQNWTDAAVESESVMYFMSDTRDLIRLHIL